MNQKVSIDYILTQSPESERRRKSVAAMKRFFRVHAGQEVKPRGKQTAVSDIDEYYRPSNITLDGGSVSTLDTHLPLKNFRNAGRTKSSRSRKT